MKSTTSPCCAQPCTNWISCRGISSSEDESKHESCGAVSVTRAGAGSACACAGGTTSCLSQSAPKSSAMGSCSPANMDCDASCAGACGSKAGFGCEVGVSGIGDSSTTESAVVLLDRGPDEPRPQPAPSAPTIADSRSVRHGHKAKTRHCREIVTFNTTTAMTKVISEHVDGAATGALQPPSLAFSSG